MRHSGLFRLFAEEHNLDFTNRKLKEIEKDIFSKPKDYVLNIDETEFIDSLIYKYQLDNIKFHFENKSFDKPKKVKKTLEHRNGRQYQKDVYKFILKIPFDGSIETLKIRPPTMQLRTIEVLSYRRVEDLDPDTIVEQYIEVPFDIYNKDKIEFETNLNNIVQTVNLNVENINSFINSFNSQVEREIRNKFKLRKDEFLDENDFFEAIELNVNEDTSSLFNANPIKKKKIPVPQLDNSKKNFFSEPQMTQDIYKDVNNTILNYCKSIEKKPSIYLDKDEESLRFLILSVLESRYESTTATGETFNKGGKTDILLKYQDGTNLYVGECKIWGGEKQLNEAIKQLFGYITWRDSKTALIIFVKTKDFSSVLDKIENTIKGHSDYNEKIDSSADNSMQEYIFNFPDDSKKKFYLTVLAFHFI